MHIKVKFLATFRDLFQSREKIIALPEGARLRQLLGSLCDSAERREAVFGKEETLSPHIVIMKNGVPVQNSGGLDAALEDGDVIAIFPFIGGG